MLHDVQSPRANGLIKPMSNVIAPRQCSKLTPWHEAKVTRWVEPSWPTHRFGTASRWNPNCDHSVQAFLRRYFKRTDFVDIDQMVEDAWSLHQHHCKNNMFGSHVLRNCLDMDHGVLPSNMGHPKAENFAAMFAILCHLGKATTPLCGHRWNCRDMVVRQAARDEVKRLSILWCLESKSSKLTWFESSHQIVVDKHQILPDHCGAKSSHLWLTTGPASRGLLLERPGRNPIYQNHPKSTTGDRP